MEKDSKVEEKRKKSHRRIDNSEERKGSKERKSSKTSERAIEKSSSGNNTNGHRDDNDKRDSELKVKGEKVKEGERSRDKEKKRSRDKDEKRSRERGEKRSRDKDEKRSKDKDEKRSRDKDEKRSRDKDEKRTRDKDEKRSRDKDERRSRDKDEKRSSKSSRSREDRDKGSKDDRDRTSKEDTKKNSQILDSVDEQPLLKKSEESIETKPEEEQEPESDAKLREAAMLEALRAKEEEEEEPDYDYDEEEFDDYDDDFESEVENEDEVNEFSSDSYDDSDSYVDSESSSNDIDEQENGLSEAERLQIREAMVLENSRVGSSSPAMLPSSPANTPVPGSPASEVREKAKQRRSARGLDFATAQKTQAVTKALSKSAQRGNDLMRLIELDTIYFDFFELKPQTEYELFMRSFGRSETYQKYTQYNEDSIDKETSTEPSDTKTCWTQHPIEASLASAHEGEDTENEEDTGRYNPVTLSKFVSFSSQVVFTLLEERASRHGYTHTFKPIEASKISNSAAQFPPNQIAAGRSPIFTYPISAQMFMTCYSKSKTDSLVNSVGFSCTWNLQNVYDPVTVLISNSAHRCGCVSSYNHNIVFVGCEDGSVCLWDLNESDSMHKSYQLNNKHFVGRLPTYSTSSIQVAESHNSKITSIQAIRFDQEQLQMSSYQIASLDEHGVIVIWVVLPVLDTSFSGSQTDLGLRPGGKIKLVKSASINTNFPQNSPDLFPELRTYAFQQSYSDSNLYYVATDKGAVLKASRTQSLSHPNYYAEENAVPSIVGSIDFNKFNWKYFLSGSSDGSISLYAVGRSTPLVVWDRSTRGRPIRSVRWSHYSSTIFYVMDSANKFYLWDLSVRDSTPLVIETYDQKGLLSFTELLPSAGGQSSPVIILGFKDGSIAAHHVKEEAMNNKIDNVTKLQGYLSLVL